MKKFVEEFENFIPELKSQVESLSQTLDQTIQAKKDHELELENQLKESKESAEKEKARTKELQLELESLKSQVAVQVLNEEAMLIERNGLQDVFYLFFKIVN